MVLPGALANHRARTSFACVGAAVTGFYFLLPDASAAESAIYQLFSVSAFILLLIRGLRTRGRDRLGWLCFSVSMLCFAGGDFVWVFYSFLSSSEMPYPSFADVLYLAGYPFVVLGMFFAFSGRQGRSFASFLEASIVTCASGLLIWLIVIQPTGQAHGASLLVRLTGAAYPTMDFLLLAALSQSLFRGRRRGGLLAMVAAALMIQTVADLLYARLTLSGLYTSGNWIDAAWMISYLIWGVAALSPSRQERTKAAPTSAGVSWLPLSLMFLALLCPPLTLMVETAWNLPLQLKSVIPAWLVIAVLVFTRLALLIREVVATEAIRQEQTQALRVQNTLLEASERERTRLLARTSEVAEHERMRIAAQLHDGPIQKLTVVAFKLDRLERRIARDEDGAEPLIREIRDQLEIEMSSLRRVMSELRPPILDERNLAAALNDCAEQVFADAPLTHRTTCDLGPEAPAPEVETAVYRVVREALMNVREHASATRVDVELARRGDWLHLLIVDDGGGFDDDASNGRFGLLGMEERIGSVGGTFEVAGALGIGTRVEATLPWKPRVAAHPDELDLPLPALA